MWRDKESFVSRSDNLPVINGIVTLIEIPSYEQRVQVSGFTEVLMENFIKSKFIEPNEFVVDYSSGIVQFHPDNEGKTFAFIYYGKGVRLIAASRVYAMVQKNPDIVTTLQDYIDTLVQFNSDLTVKLTEINNAITLAQQATQDTNLATDNSVIATQNANEAAQTALDAASTTVVIRKPPVSKLEYLETTYPEPENGWQVIINDTGDFYRFDGVNSGQWELVGNIIGGLTYVSETSDGILRKEDYGVFIERTAFFSLPKILSQGVQSIGFFKMPSDGEIMKVEAFCTEVGLNHETEISIDRISKDDLVTEGHWDNIFSQNLILNKNELLAIGGVVSDTDAMKDDLFRINVSQFDGDIRGITITMTIKISYTV